MASNTHTLADQDGDYEDWIEIENISGTTVNLVDWSLTDSPGNPGKWRFPATNLPPGGLLVVFASDKDRRLPGAPLHTNFKLGADGEYLALVDPDGTIATEFSPTYPGQVSDVSYGFAVTATNRTFVSTGAVVNALVPSVANDGAALNYTWIGSTNHEPFNTASWTSGTSGIGFGVGGVALNLQSSMLNSNASAFARFLFNVSNPTNYSLLLLRMRYDDGFIAWLNGTRIARNNAPEEDLGWNSAALAAHSASAFEDIVLNGADGLLRQGTNVLAIQGLNLAENNGTFFIQPELIGLAYAGNNTPLYFTAPTPGSENLGGAIAPGPGIADVSHSPQVPGENDPLTVTARVFPTAAAVASVTLYYRVMFGSEIAVPMFDDGVHGDGAAGDLIFGASIPANASASGEMIRYQVRAADVGNTVTRLPVYSDPNSMAQYYGTVVNPDYVTSALPVVHLFAPPSVLQPGPTTSQTGADSEAGARVSLFFNGEFYDNIQMQLRGNSTAGYNKKSHRLEFNREHPFRYSASSSRRIRKTSFMADYPDPACMRQQLCYWLGEQFGLQTPMASKMRVQLNGSFYQLVTHSDVQGEEMLERFGFDPDGALYANVGQVTPGRASTGGFEMKTRKWSMIDGAAGADYYDLANAISESLPAGQRATNLFDRLDVPQVINYLVVARFTHQNDDVWANMALYHDNDGDDLWRVLPYDQNLSFGAAFMDSFSYSGMQVTNDSLKSHPLYGSSQTIAAGSGAWNRIYDVIFQVPATREMYLRRLRSLLDEYVKPPGTPLAEMPIEQMALTLRNTMGPDAAADRAWWSWPGKGGQCNFDPGINLTNGVDQLINLFMAPRRQHFYGTHSVTNTALAIGINKSSNAGIPLAQPSNAVVNIATFDFNPVGGNQDQEYVQITNPNSFAVDLSHWKLDGGIHFEFKPGTVIPANGVIHVSPGVKAFRNRANSPRGGQGLFVTGPYSGRLNAWGETLTLSDAAARLVSSNSFAGNPSPAQRYLRITEIMYNPSAAPAITNDAQQFEYVELKNISTNVTLDLAGVQFVGGIAFSFTGSAVASLSPGQTVLVVRSVPMFTARYGGGFNIAGAFSGALDNGGETLRLEDDVGEKILEFEYNDRWYPVTDGLGFSLVIVDENAHWSAWADKISWRASGVLNGSPGVADPLPPSFAPIVINEVLSHTDLPQHDLVELFNPGSNTVNIGGWYLTDDFQTPKKYRIPSGTTIASGEYVTIDDTQFGVGAEGFRFSESGEGAYLFAAGASSNLTGFYHGYEFAAAPNGVSFGRYTNSQGEVHFVLQSAVTPGSLNAYPRVGPVVVSEIMYHPPDAAGSDDAIHEFIELQNITGTNVPLYDVSFPTNTWRLRDAVDYDFPTGETLAAGARLLVVGFDPTNAAQTAAFRSTWGVSNNVPIFGPWIGKLDNSGETIELKQPGPPDDTLRAPYYLIDKIAYADAAPWPSGADGIGNSLQRVSASGYGNDPTNWFAAGVSAGRATVANLAPTISIPAPVDGLVITSTNGLPVSVLANDPDGALALVQLFGDGFEIGRWTASSSNFLWTTASVGHHYLKARVTDNLGAISESTPISVLLLAPPPTVSMTAPANRAILQAGTSVQLSAQAHSAGGPAAKVDYLLDGLWIGSVTAPFDLMWTAGTAGYHELSAVAYDAAGQASEPSSLTVFVQAVSLNPVAIASGSQWRYLDDGVNQGTSWIAPNFSDGSWSSGFGRFGFNNANSGFATLLSYGNNASSKYPAYYFRKEFVVPSLAGMSNLFLEVQRDDGVAVYLNGQNLYRNNLPSGTLSFSQLANNASDNGANWQSAVLPLVALVQGTNVIAAEVHQSSAGSSDLVFDLRLTLLGYLTGAAITAEPEDVTVTNGSAAGFSVTVIGSVPIGFQWQHNGTNIPGATGNTLVVPSVSQSDVGAYQVVVSNALGAVTSQAAVLSLEDQDSDGDGMPDAWELANGTSRFADDAGIDVDLDGLSNFEEYLAGTSPTNAVSVLKFDSAAWEGTNLILTFAAVSNRSYTIQQRTELESGSWLKWQDVPTAPIHRIVRLTNSAAGANRFYRLTTPALP